MKGTTPLYSVDGKCTEVLFLSILLWRKRKSSNQKKNKNLKEIYVKWVLL